MRGRFAFLAQRLLELYSRQYTEAWPWFEDRATYCNARLSQALITAGRWQHDDKMTQAGLMSLEWLAAQQKTADGYFAPIGSEGWWVSGGKKAEFDQQPVEACAMVSASLEAWRTTRDDRWAREARRAFSWLLGENQLRQSLYDPVTGGCRDGLQPGKLNPNQGAESTLSFLMALCELQAAGRA